MVQSGNILNGVETPSGTECKNCAGRLSSALPEIGVVDLSMRWEAQTARVLEDNHCIRHGVSYREEARFEVNQRSVALVPGRRLPPLRGY